MPMLWMSSSPTRNLGLFHHQQLSSNTNIFSLFYRQTLLFEKAYCEYRLGNSAECLKTIESNKQPSFRDNELKCQAVSENDQLVLSIC